MYRTDRNNFFINVKNSTVQTPENVSQFLFDLLHDKIERSSGTVFDPCVGTGSLLAPWENLGYKTKGLDIEDQGWPNTEIRNYLELESDIFFTKPSLVLINPPFNIDQKNKELIKKNHKGRPLLPEVFLQKTVELFGLNQPIVLFTPPGLRLNQTTKSKRYQNFINGGLPPISGIVALTKNTFLNVEFHSEILIFNIKLERGHYFIGEDLL